MAEEEGYGPQKNILPCGKGVALKTEIKTEDKTSCIIVAMLVLFKLRNYSSSLQGVLNTVHPFSDHWCKYMDAVSRPACLKLTFQPEISCPVHLPIPA